MTARNYIAANFVSKKNLSSHPTKDYVKMALNRIKRTSMLQTFNAHFMYVIKQHQIVD